MVFDKTAAGVGIGQAAIGSSALVVAHVVAWLLWQFLVSVVAESFPAPPDAIFMLLSSLAAALFLSRALRYGTREPCAPRAPPMGYTR